MNIDFKKIPDDLKLESFVLLNIIFNKEFELLDKLIEKYHPISIVNLQLKSYIKVTNSDPNSWIIRKKALDLFPIIEKHNNLHDIAEKIRDIFPKGVKSGGYSVRSNVKDLEDKLKKFNKDYKYSPEIVIEATIRYVNELKKQDYNFMLLSKYFIHKEGKGSTLAEYCDIIINGEEEEVEAKSLNTMI